MEIHLGIPSKKYLKSLHSFADSTHLPRTFEDPVLVIITKSETLLQMVLRLIQGLVMEYWPHLWHLFSHTVFRHSYPSRVRMEDTYKMSGLEVFAAAFQSISPGVRISFQPWILGSEGFTHCPAVRGVESHGTLTGRSLRHVAQITSAITKSLHVCNTGSLGTSDVAFRLP